ncbi:MAG: MOSC domain-containing protein [Stappiaceae bacterium]
MFNLSGSVNSVSSSPDHRFSKEVQTEIKLVAGKGVEGDAHFGETIQHLSRIQVDPSQPNLRQVHLIQSELFSELIQLDYSVMPGDLGENITTIGLDLLAMPRSTVLKVGVTVRIGLTGLRNPCHQIDGFQSGLLGAVLTKKEDGSLIRKAGVMGIVLSGGSIRPGDSIEVGLPEIPHRRLERV